MYSQVHFWWALFTALTRKKQQSTRETIVESIAVGARVAHRGVKSTGGRDGAGDKVAERHRDVCANAEIREPASDAEVEKVLSLSTALLCRVA